MTGRTSLAFRASALLAVILVTTLAGCSSGPAAPPLPPLEGAEPQVQAAVKAAHDELAQDTRVSDAWGHYGMVLDVHDFAQSAIDAYTEASELAPSEFRWWYYRANRVARNDPEAALPLFQKAREINPEYAALLMHMGRALEQLGKWDEALQLFQRSTELDPHSAVAFAGVGRSQFAVGHTSEARTALEKALALDPNCGVAFASLAQVYDKLGETQRAATMSARAANSSQQGRIDDPLLSELEALGQSTDQIINRANALGQAGAADQAVAELTALIQAYPVRTDVYTALGQHQLQLTRFEDALASFQEAKQRDPNSTNAQLGIADALRFAHRLPEAIKAYQTLIQSDSKLGEAYRGLGICLVQQNELSAAAGQMRKALALLPDDRAVRSVLARLEYLEFNDDAVITVLQPLLPANNPQAPPDRLTLDAVLYSGLAMLRSGRSDEGKQLIDESLAAGEDVAAVAYELGEIGHAEFSIEILRQALARNPNDANAMLALAYERACSPQAEVRNGQEALQLIGGVIQRGVGGSRALEVRACALAELGRFSDAIQTLEQAMMVAKQGAPQTAIDQLQGKIDQFHRNEPFRYTLQLSNIAKP